MYRPEVGHHKNSLYNDLSIELKAWLTANSLWSQTPLDFWHTHRDLGLYSMCFCSTRQAEQNIDHYASNRSVTHQKMENVGGGPHIWQTLCTMVYNAGWCSTFSRSMVHNVVLYPQGGAQCRSHKPGWTDGGTLQNVLSSLCSLHISNVHSLNGLRIENEITFQVCCVDFNSQLAL